MTAERDVILRAFFQETGAQGGRSRSPKKLKALRVSIRKAQAARAKKLKAAKRKKASR